MSYAFRLSRAGPKDPAPRYLNQLDPLDTGSVTRNRVPCPGALLKSIRPS